jgi:hypothetical protein
MHSLRHCSTQISGPLKTYADILTELRLRMRQLHPQSPCKSQIYRPCVKSDFTILYADSFAQDLYNDLVRCHTGASDPNADPDPESDPNSNPDSNPSNVRNQSSIVRLSTRLIHLKNHYRICSNTITSYHDSNHVSPLNFQLF